METLRLLLHWFSLLLLLFLSASISAKAFNLPRLSPLGRSLLQEIDAVPSYSLLVNDFKTYYYDQTLDHFNYGPESYTTFKQKYLISSRYFGGANESLPILAYLGAEAPLDIIFPRVGFLNDNAPHFKALLVYIEHRFYGESVPFGSFDEAMKNETLRGYFSSAQAIADYVEVLLHVKKRFASPNSPIIVSGGSYGGMLAAWFRLKYPHIAIGALASSAPILYFDNIIPQDGYYSVVTKDFREASESCYKTIRQSWSEIDKIAFQPNGLSILSERFKTCSHLNKSIELKEFLDSIYASAAQYNHPPDYPAVNMICEAIDGEPNGTDTLGRIFAGMVAFLRINMSCYDVNTFNQPSETSIGWKWQTCSEMVMPIGRGNNDTMFYAAPFDLKEFILECKDFYGVPPRPHWITTYYGGHDIKLVLQRFGSNIIFSNGLRDPYSSAGVLEDLSDSLLAVYTHNGSHCLDMRPAREDDPQWLVRQRKIEVEIIDGWLANYYADLAINNRN